MKSTKLTSGRRMKSKSMRPMSETLIIRVRIMIQISALNRLKNNSSTNNSSNTYNNNTKSNYESPNQHNSTNSGYGHSKPHQQEKPVNVSVTLHGPVSKDQLYKIQEVLRHPIAIQGQESSPRTTQLKASMRPCFQ